MNGDTASGSGQTTVPGTVRQLSGARNQALRSGEVHSESNRPPFEVIDAIELAKRWAVPASWIREQVRSRATNPIPHVRLGRYVRFEWWSPELGRWWDGLRSALNRRTR
jgi:hypothetical protein